jgi:hypothetical protein
MSLLYNSELLSFERTFQQMEIEFDDDCDSFSSSNKNQVYDDKKLLSLHGHSIHIAELITSEIRQMYEKYLFPLALNEIEIWKAESFSSLSSYRGWSILNNFYDGIYISYSESTVPACSDDRNKGSNYVSSPVSKEVDDDNVMDCTDDKFSSFPSAWTVSPCPSFLFPSSTSCYDLSSSASLTSSLLASRPCVSSSPAIILSPKLKGTFSLSWENNVDGTTDPLAMITERLITIFTSNALFRSILEEKMSSNESN